MTKTKSTKKKPTKAVIAARAKAARALKKAKAKKPVKATRKEVLTALDGRKKLVLQKRNGDTIVYVRMTPGMYDKFEAAYAAYCTKKLLNPKSYGMSSFVRENAFDNLVASGKL